MHKLVKDGGNPVRESLLQYGKQTIEQEDIDAVVNVLKTNTYLTTGPIVEEFENKCKQYCGSKFAIAVNSATSALHCATASLNLNGDDEVIVSNLSFVASANCILYLSLIHI